MKTLWTWVNGVLALALLAMWATACAPTGNADELFLQEVQTMMGEADGAYVLLTLASTLTPDVEQRLVEAGIVLFDPLGENRFQAYVPQTAVATLTTLRDANVILDVTAIDPATKIKGAFANPQETYNVIVQFYAAPAENETAVLADHMIVNRTAVGAMNFVEGQATGAQIKQLADLPFVKLVEEAVVSSGG